MSSVVLSVRALSLTRGERMLFSHIDLDLLAGQLTTLSGPSGGGKSSLLKILARLLNPSSGTLAIDSQPAEALKPADYRRKVAYLPQQAPMLPGSVADNIALGPKLNGQTLARGDILALLEQVALPTSFADRRASELSGGESQRVAVARALANQPRVLLLDEPTSALDPLSAEKLLLTIRQVAQSGVAVVVVTHVRAHAQTLTAGLESHHYQLATGTLQAVEP